MEIRAVRFRVGAEWRVGGLFYPGGPGKTGAVLMLHGFPGVLQNEDIACELCRRGLTVFMPHFRGCWGSSGEFSVPALFEDARASLRLLEKYHHVDPKRVGLLGYSVGGWVALRLASEIHPAAAAVLAPAVPGPGGAASTDYIRRNGKVLALPPADRLWEEYLEAAKGDHPEAYVHEIAPTPLLFVQGLKDRVVPPPNTVRLWKLAGGSAELLSLDDDDHEFQADRASLVRTVAGWLASRLSSPLPASV